MAERNEKTANQSNGKPSIIPGFPVSMARWCQFASVVLAWTAGLMTYACKYACRSLLQMACACLANCSLTFGGMLAVQAVLSFSIS